MITDDQQIIYVAEGDAVVYYKMQEQRQIGNAGFTTKKIVITTKRFLIFQSLGNRLQETQYELTTTMAKKAVKGVMGHQAERKMRVSVNGVPEVQVDVLALQPKIVIEEEPAIYRYLQKQNIQNIVKSMTGLVILKAPKKNKFYLAHMGTIPNAIKIAKAIKCAQSWKKYRSFCKDNKVEENLNWVRILTQIVQNDNSVVLIDPDLFITGSQQEIETFVFLMAMIQFAHCFHHRYNITTPESANYAEMFIIQIEKKIHSLSFKQTNLNASNLRIVLNKVTLPNLLKLDLSHNMLDDQVFEALTRTIKAGAKRLTYINLSKNQIRMGNPQLLVQLLKSIGTIINLDISHNSIDDSSTETFQKYVIFALNPPLEELNISFNKFTRKMAWRLFVGNLRNFKSHPYLKFILYPIPIKKQIFSEFDVDFPKHNTTINLNMHSALAEEFEQESFLRHTFEDMPATSAQMLTINFRRVMATNVKLPTNRQELNKTLQISNKVQNFIYSPQAVEKIYNMALELKKFPYEVPPISKAHFVKYLYQKFNEALFIRDHYSVKYLFKALLELHANVQGYTQRLAKVKQRDGIYAKRAQSILNFEIDEAKINEELDELVREGLRLYLQGYGVQLVYYLKYRRDQYIEKYLQEKLNPEHLLFDLMAKKNISAEQHISEKQFIVPYEIRLEKKINEHFYLHPWQANYQILSEMKSGTFDVCLQFLQQSEKKQKFALYFDRIEERIEFIKNEFAYFSFNKFKASYSDLKINACRLLYLYNNIKDTTLYLQIPIYVKKRLVTPERNWIVLNKQWFRKEYHVINYLNINMKARKGNFYNYEGVLCRYNSDLFQTEVKKILPTINDMLKKIEVGISTRISLQAIIPRIIEHIKYIIDVIRHSLVPEQLKEQLYLHLIGWRKGRYGTNNQVLQLLPAFTMYLKPPIYIEKYLVAAILQNENSDLADLPLCLATNPNQPTTDNVLILESQFVERDWVPNDKIYCQLFDKKGKVNLQVQTLQKTCINITVAESKTVAELISMLADSVEMVVEDKNHFWLYKLNRETKEIVAYESREHVGEILADFDPKDQILLLKRRIYARQLKYNFNKYAESMINSLYHDVKYEYLCRNFFASDKLAIDIASMLFMIETAENILLDATNKKSAKIKHTLDEMTMDKMLIEKQKQLDSNFPIYIPQKIYKRLGKNKETIVPELKAKISERLLKGEYTNIFEMKLNFLNIVSGFPEFVSTNYIVKSKDFSEMRLSINSMYIYVENQFQTEFIHIEKLVSIHPKSKYLLIYYHKQENLVTQIPVFADQKVLFSIAMDILSYCSVRIKMSSINLYEIHHLEDLINKIAVNEQSLRRVYDRTVQKDLAKYKEEYESSIKKIGKVSITLMQLKELQYYNKNNYIKTEVNRKLYANKSEKKLDFEKEIDQDEMNEINQANKRIMQLMFPQFSMKVNQMDQNEPEEEQIKQRKINDSNDSVDYKKEYKKLDFETTQKKEQPKSPYPQTNKKNEKPPELSPYRPPPEPVKEDEPEQDVITNKKATAKKPARRRGQ